MPIIRFILLATLLLGGVEAFAQQPAPLPERKSSIKVEPPKTAKDKTVRSEPLVRTELGLGVGLQYPWMKVQKPESMSAVLSPRMGFGAALQFRISIGKFFGIQPEVTYSYSTVKIEDAPNDISVKARSNLVQMPILISFRAAMFRFNFGPVITLMDSPHYTLSEEKMYLGRLFPTVTYAAGVSVKFAKCMMIDVRYAGQFSDIKASNSYTYNAEMEAIPFKTRNSSVQLRFGYVF